VLKNDNYDWVCDLLVTGTADLHIAQLTLLTVPSPCIAFY
jgi:hypothetical protein